MRSTDINTLKQNKTNKKTTSMEQQFWVFMFIIFSISYLIIFTKDMWSLDSDQHTNVLEWNVIKM